MAGVSDWLPLWDVRERHHRLVCLPPAEALQLALDTPVAGDPIVRALFRLRGLRGLDLTIGEFSSRGAFLALERTPDTYVFGIAANFLGDRHTARTTDEWSDWRRSGVKIAADLRATTTVSGKTRLSTETRVLALDTPHRIAFRAYWLFVGPFSALIRRRWLRAIAETAARSARRRA